MTSATEPDRQHVERKCVALPARMLTLGGLSAAIDALHHAGVAPTARFNVCVSDDGEVAFIEDAGKYPDLGPDWRLVA